VRIARFGLLSSVCLAIVVATASARADDLSECNRRDNLYVVRIPACTTAIRQTPGSAQLYVNRGLAHHGLSAREGPKERDEALADFDKAIALDPKHVNAHIYRGETLRSMGQYDKAFADFDRAIEIDPTSGDAYFARGGTYSVTDKRTEAIADYTTAIKLNPNNSNYYHLRGSCYDLMGKKPEAAADLRKSLSLNPKNERARILLKDVLSRM